MAKGKGLRKDNSSLKTKRQYSPRYLAVNLLHRVATAGSYANIALDQLIAQTALTGRDTALLTNLVYGVIQRQLTLDFYLQPFIKKPNRLQDWVKQDLWVAVYQMVYLTKIPDRAIFYEAAEIAKAKNRGAAGFVTAVLHQIQRQGLPDLNKIKSPLQRLSVSASVPQWLVEKLIDQLGQVKTSAILKTINQPPAASLRVNTAVTSVEKVQTQLAALDLPTKVSALSSVGLVRQGGFLAGTSLFKEGAYTLQDESSMLVASSMRLQPHHQVLDVCAAPGGKTTHIAALLSKAAGGHVTAFDLYPHKIKLLQQNARRLQVADLISAHVGDARHLDSVVPDQHFDRVLVDAPCSGLGLMRRKPEIKYARQPADLMNLQQLQLEIINQAALKVKPGGILTYSTCTIVNEENQAVIAQFLQQHPEFTPLPVQTDHPLKVATTPYLKLYPDDYGTDGFFICNLKRKSR